MAYFGVEYVQVQSLSGALGVSDLAHTYTHAHTHTAVTELTPDGGDPHAPMTVVALMTLRINPMTE